ncbi:MAG: MarC family protein [Thermodesulfovibrionales bacterium]
MEESLGRLASAFIPLFVAIDVFGVLPFFVALTADIPDIRKGRVVRQSVFTALAVSVAFTVVGKAAFRVLGIMADDFKVAGGLVLLVFAILDLTRYERRRPKETRTVGVVPIGVPLIAGPATLTTILVLVDRHGMAPTLIALALNLVLVWLVLLGARRVVRLLGENGVAALSKIMALLLAAIAIMMIRLGLEGIIAGR